MESHPRKRSTVPNVTYWPGHAVPEPLVNHGPLVVVRSSDDRLVAMTGQDPWEPFAREAHLDPDFVVRHLLAVDLNDPTAVAHFVNRYGTVDLAAQDRLHLPTWSDEDGLDPTTQPKWQRVALELRIHRALVRHWQAGNRGENPAEGWRAEGLDELLADAQDYAERAGLGVDQKAAEVARAWSLFRAVMNSQLGKFHVEVLLDFEDEELGRSDEPKRTNLGPAIALQLWNLMAQSYEPKECANERCDVVFVFQDSNKERQRVRTRGLMYCSSKCAKAQLERVRRRKLADEEQRKKTTKTKKGLS